MINGLIGDYCIFFIWKKKKDLLKYISRSVYLKMNSLSKFLREPLTKIIFKFFLITFLLWLILSQINWTFYIYMSLSWECQSKPPFHIYIYVIVLSLSLRMRPLFPLYNLVFVLWIKFLLIKKKKKKKKPTIPSKVIKSMLGSKDLGFMYLELWFVLLVNHDQNNVFKLF